MKYKVKQIIGFVFLGLNILWTGHWFWLFYAYHFTSILWFYMYPAWVLILNILIGLIGIYLGYRLIKDKISIINSLIIDVPILALGMFVSSYIPQ